MKPRRCIPFLAALVLVFLQSLSQGAESLASRLKDAHTSSWSKTAPAQYTKEEQDAAQKLILKTLQPDAERSVLQPAWKSLGMSLDLLSSKTTTLWIIRSSAANQSGRGFLVIRRGEAEPVFLQAPHSRADKHTGEILYNLFASVQFRAAMWNSCHRKQRDAAHHSPSLLEAACRAFVRFSPRGTVIQLHGYSQSKRKTEEGKKAEAIVSAGSLFVTPEARAVHKGFKEELGWKSALFPLDVSELGARTNTQGKALRNEGSLGFVHIEISEPRRQELLKDADLRRKLAVLCQNCRREPVEEIR